MKIAIGQRPWDFERSLLHGATKAAAPIMLDIDALVYSKALVQANSGGGKSGLIRVIAEQAIPHIPTIIIDPEGEFSTLREKFDIVLVGDQGEIEADPRSAGLLARKLVELGASAVLDIYELKPEAKHLFVQNFLESLMALPRKLWRPTFIVIDEAQLFAPEKGMGESNALPSVADLQMRGRKRGFGTILATPRLSMLHKNVAGANNIFIGRTNLDTDQKRCGKALGKTDKEAIELRTLKPREFYCYGPDLNVDGVTLFRVADCQTTIRKPGDRKSMTPPKASHVVAQIADKLKDIQLEAEKEIRDLNDAKKEIATLTRDLKAAQKNQTPREQDTNRIEELTAQLATERAKEKPAGKPTVKEKKIVIAKDLGRMEQLTEKCRTLFSQFEDYTAELASVCKRPAALLTEAKAINAMELYLPGPAIGFRTPTGAVSISGGALGKGRKPPIRPPIVDLGAVANKVREIVTSNGELSAPEQRILNALAWWKKIGVDKPSKGQVGFISKYRVGKKVGGAYGNLLGQLRSKGYIEYPSAGQVELTSAGADIAQGPQDFPGLEDLHKAILSRLDNPEQRVLTAIANVYPDKISKQKAGEIAGYTVGEKVGGAYGNILGSLRTLGLIDYPSPGQVTATSLLFPEGLS